MEYEYFYLGLEARRRENRYECLDQAIKDARYAAKRTGIPVRIFGMLPTYKSRLLKVVRPHSKPDGHYEKVKVL